LGHILDNAKERIRERIDMVALVSDYVSLKPKSHNDFWGCCPFHEEKSASFHVLPEKGRYKCFGCGKGGDIFRFVEETQGVGFREALSILATRAGVELESASPEEQRRRDHRRDMQRVSALAAEFFESVLWSDTPAGETGRAVLEKRGITEECARAFGLGIAPPGWDALTNFARQRDLPLDVLLELGLLKTGRKDPSRPYDFFRNRLMFPIRDEQGKVVAFGGRRLDDQDEPKYINSPEIPGFYEKRKILYGLDRARTARPRNERLVVVEGYLDVVIPHQAGHTEFVATLGTAFTTEHANLARRSVEDVVLLFDADDAGANASLKALANLVGIDRLSVRVAQLPPGMDPDDAVRKDPGLLQASLDEADDLVGYVIDQTLVGFDRASPAGQQRAVRAALKLLAKIPDKIRLHREARLVAHRFGLPERVLRDELSREEVDHRREQLQSQRPGGRPRQPSPERARGQRERSAPRGSSPDPRPRQAPVLQAIPRSEECLLEALLGAPEEVARLTEEGYGPQDFTPGPSRRLAGEIFALAAAGKLEPARVMSAVEADDERALCARLMGRLDAEKKYVRELSGMVVLRHQRLQARIHEANRELRAASDKQTKSHLLAEIKQLRAQLQPGPTALKAR
jgi:DNA primase